jgi:hypothetical protein
MSLVEKGSQPAQENNSPDTGMPGGMPDPADAPETSAQEKAEQAATKLKQIQQKIQQTIDSIINVVKGIATCVSTPAFWIIVAAILLFTIVWAGLFVWGMSDFNSHCPFNPGGGEVTHGMMESLGWAGDLDEGAGSLARLNAALQHYNITSPISIIALINVTGPETSWGAHTNEICSWSLGGSTPDLDRTNGESVCHGPGSGITNNEYQMRHRGAGYIQVTNTSGSNSSGQQRNFLKTLGYADSTIDEINSTADYIGYYYPWESAAWYWTNPSCRLSTLCVGDNSINAWLETQNSYTEIVCYVANNAVLTGSLAAVDANLINSQGTSVSFSSLSRAGQYSARCQQGVGSHFDTIMDSEFKVLAGGGGGFGGNMKQCLGFGTIECLTQAEAAPLITAEGVWVMDCALQIEFCMRPIGTPVSPSYHLDWVPCSAEDNEIIRHNFGYRWTHRRGVMSTHDRSRSWATTFTTMPHDVGSWPGTVINAIQGSGSSPNIGQVPNITNGGCNSACANPRPANTGHACAHFFNSGGGSGQQTIIQSNLNEVCDMGCLG